MRSASSSLLRARKGVHSSEDFRNLMGALMSDVVQGTVTPGVVNAACSAGRGLLKMVELEYQITSRKGIVAHQIPLSRRVGA